MQRRAALTRQIQDKVESACEKQKLDEIAVANGFREYLESRYIVFSRPAWDSEVLQAQGFTVLESCDFEKTFSEYLEQA
jgi:hypothetical protein